MKIAYIAAGAGGMYCGSCLRDNALARELTMLGHPTSLLPIYTPLRTDEESHALPRVFYNGIGVYLAQEYRFFRRERPLLDRLLAFPAFLKLLRFIPISTSPRSVGDLLLSVLRGTEGNHRKSLEELGRYLEEAVRPDVIHITNSLLAGLAGPLKRRLRAPAVVSFQGEDLFLAGLPEVHREQAYDLIRKSCGEIDAFTATSAHTASLMAGRLALPLERIAVVYPGIRTSHFPHPRGLRPPGRPFTIGSMARIAPEKGLAFLCEAFRILCGSFPGGGRGPEAPRLLACGTMDRTARSYMDDLRRRLESWGLSQRFEYRGEVDLQDKIRFLGEIDVLSMPSVYPEAKGIPVYEGLACGVPAVLPRSGAFPEIIEKTGGGITVEPGSAEALAQGLRMLHDDPALGIELGRRGSENVRTRFTVEAMARSTLKVYDEILSRR